MVSGLLLALSFPSFGHPVLGWIALAPLMMALGGSNGPGLHLGGGSLARAFLLGVTTGVIYFTGTLYWITSVMVLHGSLQWWVAVLVNAALIAYLSLFPAIFAVVVRRMVMRFGSLALMTAPLVWVATEMGRTYIFTGFPWVLLGYSQTSVLPVAQLASVVGVYGLSALVASVSAGVAVFGLGFAETSAPNPATAGSHADRGSHGHLGSAFRRIVPVAAPLVVVALVAMWGAVRLNRSTLTTAGDQVRIGLIQGNVDQSEKWNPARAGAIFEEYLRMTEVAIAKGADVVVWPEASTPFFFEEHRDATERVRAIARRSGVPILLGSNQVERDGGPRYFNAAFLVGPDGSTAGAYRKMHLVPFGEYVPLQRLLFFAAPLVEAVGAFSAGDQAVLLPVRGHTMSTAICYEIVYPGLVRRFVSGGSELLSTITNDAWFGRTSAPYQHFQQASMRAIENGRYLVRAANTGISGAVDPYGRVMTASPIFEPAVIVSDVRFLSSSTLYARTGDIIGYASVVMTLAMLFLARRRVE